MIIQILNVTVETKPTAKGSYQMAEVAFKNLSYQGKVESKKVMSFGAGASVFAAIKDAAQGSKWDITVVKNTTTGYNDWTAATVSTGDSPANVAPAASPVSKYTTAATTKTTYETPEERAIKQVYIVRQSSVSAAINTLSVGSKTPPKSDDVIALAKEYESYVFGRSLSNQADEGSINNGFEDMESDIPL